MLDFVVIYIVCAYLFSKANNSLIDAFTIKIAVFELRGACSVLMSCHHGPRGPR